jgi:hypothetical protein
MWLWNIAGDLDDLSFRSKEVRRIVSIETFLRVIYIVTEYTIETMLELLSLPDIVLEKILSYLTYDDIARYRIVSTYRLEP